MHGFYKAIVSHCDEKFTTKIWKGLFQELGTQFNSSIAYHPQTDGQTERVNQVLEDMSTTVGGLPALGIIYVQNGHQASLGMSPFETLYDKGCITLVNWDSLVNMIVLGP